MQSRNDDDEILMGIVETALALSPDECQAYLESACRNHPALSEEIRKRVEWERRMGNFLRDPILPPDSASGDLNNGPSRILRPLSCIAHYRITEKLGEGGMGEVWRAADTKLGRDVAIKVLPASVAEDRSRMARFEREARVLASLNHPNIAAIYGVEERALVMELVEGETLSGPLPAAKALPLIHQLIDALEWAHDIGIVHRDLKPANIKVTPQGRIKILDFGLAKAVNQNQVLPESGSRSTLTKAGMIIGSPAYMSPEQARGEKVDKATDVWAFGVVVYEMLTGRKLFTGETASEVLSQVLTAEPDFAAVPAPFRNLLRFSLEQDPRRRLRDIGDARVLLDDAAQPRTSSARTRTLGLLALVVVLIATGAVFAALWLRSRPTLAAPVHFTIETRGASRLSPDGRLILQETPTGIRVRSMDRTTWRLLPETDAASYSFWSPDSSAIGFFSGGRLRISSINGGGPRNLASVSAAAGGAWHGGVNSGVILFAAAGAFHVVDVSSGETRDLPLKFAAGQRPASPVFLPEGDGFLYLLEAGGDTSLFRSTLSSTEAVGEAIVETRCRAAFARDPRTGQWHLFYVSPGGTLLARPVNPGSGRSIGPPVRILDGVNQAADEHQGGFDVSQNGAVTWEGAGTLQPIWRIRWLDRKGAVVGTVGETGRYISLALAPDESKLAVLQGSPVEHIWIYNLRDGVSGRLTTTFGREGHPIWSADSRSVYYTTEAEGRGRVMRQEIATGGKSDVMYETQDPSTLTLQDITPDGRYLILIRSRAGIASGILRLDTKAPPGVTRLEPLLPNIEVSLARISPDGRSLVLSQENVVFSLPYPPSGAVPRRIASFRTAARPFFSRDGKTLYVLTDQSLLAAQVLQTAGQAISLGEPVTLFPITSSSGTSASPAALSRDGSRLLIIATDAEEELRTHVLTDWTVLLDR